jgi:hypothetical protein
VFIALDFGMAVPANWDAIGGIKRQFWVALNRKHMVDMNIPDMTTKATSVAIQLDDL